VGHHHQGWEQNFQAGKKMQPGNTTGKKTRKKQKKQKKVTLTKFQLYSSGVPPSSLINLEVNIWIIRKHFWVPS
jgi:hypothetical protein